MRYIYQPLFLVLFSLALILSPQKSKAKPLFPPQESSTIEKIEPESTVSHSYLTSLENHQDFLSMSRSYKRGRFKNIPHLMFLIDREQDKTYFINSQQYDFHNKFAREHYLTLDDDKKFFENNYYGDQRRFILGSLVYQEKQSKNQQYVIELWEGDKASPLIWQDCYSKIQAHVNFAPIAIKTNSLHQEEAINEWKNSLLEGLVPTILTGRDIYKTRNIEVINSGVAVGVLTSYDNLEELEKNRFLDAKKEEILLLRFLPLAISPVSGVITSQPSIFLSHVNILTKGWNIPNLYLKDAHRKLAKYEGKWVYLQAKQTQFSNETSGSYSIRQATRREIENKKLQIRQNKEKQKHDLQFPEVDLLHRQLTDLKEQRASDVNKFGAKAANLGEVYNAQIKDIIVPDGFSIPFVFYQEFIERNKLRPKILEALAVKDSVSRRESLAKLRADFLNLPFDPKLAKMILEKIRAEYPDAGLFFRSSTNAEDLSGFSGAGLYDTVANVSYNHQGDQAVIKAIQKVWGSIWNDAAIAARENVGIEGENHLQIYSSVLVQRGINSECSGVMITTNPYKKDKDVVYINAKRGLGMKVVEGRKVPEQILYNSKSASIKVFSHSMDDTMLTSDDKGGLKEISISTDQRVLSAKKIQSLVQAAQSIHKLFASQTFKPQPQDIEWLMTGSQVYIVQSRPFVE